MVKLGEKYSSAFWEISEAINSTINLQIILNLIVEKITSFLGVKGSSIFILENGDGELKSTASYGLSRNYLSKGPLLAGRSISETLEGKTVLITDAATDPRTQYPEAAKQEEIGAILSMPLSVHGNIIGALRVYSPEGYEFSKKKVIFVEALCQKVALAIENACQYELVEDKHESIMPDIWKWFKVKSDLRDLKVNGFHPPLSGTWQMRL